MGFVSPDNGAATGWGLSSLGILDTSDGLCPASNPNRDNIRSSLTVCKVLYTANRRPESTGKVCLGEAMLDVPLEDREVTWWQLLN